MNQVTNQNRPQVSLLAAAMVLAAGHAAVLAQPASFPLTGVVRDFRPGHPDFVSSVADAAGLSAGGVAATLGPANTPVLTGAGRLVARPAADAAGRPIAPAVASPREVTNFTISGSSITAPQAMAAKVTVIGAAISAGGAYDCPVTMQVRVGGQTHVPFGGFASATGGNVNDDRNPRNVVLPGMIAPGTALTVDGRSWRHARGGGSTSVDSGWEEIMLVNSASSGQVVALRNGDAPPAVGGFMGQVSAKDMLAPYLDANNRVLLRDNQIIYLFELGSTSQSSSAFDMQDLVVLVELATDPSFFSNPTNPTTPCGGVINDSAALFGAATDGGVSSPTSFATWFNSVPGENASATTTITMTRGADGLYSYSTSNFHPVDGELYGNQGAAFNRGFTFTLMAEGTYEQCAGQFLDFTGDGDTWVFVNGRLAIDLAGTHPGARQVVDLDRLGLTGGERVRVQLFHAQRSANYAGFGLKTNMFLETPTLAAPSVSSLFD